MYEGLFKGIRDADEVSPLVDAVGPGLRPRPHGQVVEQVAVVVIRVGHPKAAFSVPPCHERTVCIQINGGGSSGGKLEAVESQPHLVRRWEAEEEALVPWLWEE